jgi:hypothetical protein
MTYHAFFPPTDTVYRDAFDALNILIETGVVRPLTETHIERPFTDDTPWVRTLRPNPQYL